MRCQGARLWLACTALGGSSTRVAFGITTLTGMAYINLGVLALVELGNVSDPQAFIRTSGLHESSDLD